MPTILIADDEAHILRILAMWLGRHGYDVLEASVGKAAMEMLARQKVDLVISDMNMPEVDGLELAGVVRDRLKLDIPFLLLSARCDQEKLARQAEPYRVRLYPKPFTPSRLVADIREMLGTVPATG